MGFFKNRRQVQRRVSHRALSLILLLACLQSALAQSKLRLTLSGPDLGGPRHLCEETIGWSYGHWLALDYNRTAQPVICLSDWNGTSERVAFGIPDAARISLSWASLGPDGSVALMGSAYMEDGTASTFVARVSADGKERIVTRVWPYCAIRAVIVPDGTLWTMGWVLNESGITTERNVLRRFDKLGRVLSTSSIPVGRSALSYDAVSGSSLSASNDRVAWLTNGNEYIEFSLEGREILRLNGPSAAAKMAGTGKRALALSRDGQAVVGVEIPSDPKVWRLERKSNTWLGIYNPSPDRPLVRVWGFEGEEAVIERSDRGIRRFAIE